VTPEISELVQRLNAMVAAGLQGYHDPQICGELRAAADALTRSSEQAAHGWRPIATADKDHNVLVAHDGQVSEAYYDGENDAWYKAGKSPHDFDFVSSDLIFPTHWMPLPALPVVVGSPSPGEK
jgi:hypothetical protein